MDKIAMLDLLNKVSTEVENGDVDDGLIKALKILSDSFKEHKEIDKSMIEKLHDLFRDGSLIKKRSV